MPKLWSEVLVRAVVQVTDTHQPSGSSVRIVIHDLVVSGHTIQNNIVRRAENLRRVRQCTINSLCNYWSIFIKLRTPITGIFIPMNPDITQPVIPFDVRIVQCRAEIWLPEMTELLQIIKAITFSLYQAFVFVARDSMAKNKVRPVLATILPFHQHLDRS